MNAVRRASLTPKAKDILLADLEVPILSPDDIYGGKLVAALDRQHPRDLFDVSLLFGNVGITTEIRRSFVVYLASHNRPIHEVLFPTEQNVSEEYEATFRGMTSEDIDVGQLLDVRKRLMDELPRSLTAHERQFLVSLANAEPEWKLLGIDHIQQLPAVKWKVQNLQRLARKNKTKLVQQAKALADLLDAA